MNEEKIIKAGKIAKEVVDYAKSIIEPGMKLIDIANKIDDKILELGGKPAFPVNLSINEVAAHSTPAHDSDEIAKGLLKVDIGVHVDGWCADTAFSLDLDDDSENKELIKSAEAALKKALDFIEKGVEAREIGAIIGDELRARKVGPVINLSGHSIDRYDLHSGITIPNVDNGNDAVLDSGLYAIEPFATNGLGKVRDGKPSGIYQLQGEGNVRDIFSREVLKFIKEEYQTLPFCSRWIHKKFGSRGLLALRMIKQAGLLHEYAQLIESGNGKVAQAEHSILIGKDVIVTTE
ncbi:type II methionyl aminopeptidase [Candidatus Pacearchaeota archaeon CG10_big_fil_rev_8_21_14_0_10_35_219]|nr:type II methionyl aminopeptidase [Candidatus Pacearchaeota archaeon]OIO42715.1 MAG: type II methionyl aminopeptidase [Candidatus Pacearchaeota archaeon CG1_02_35_32]PIO08259.1 MAG: type II methionyl aminopeptidase [Candidatus Pacearchaeota archaeon CG10_big_fil_rev_8_21_14_0_10_35_219]PIY81860.1 MAG: type II methionyl aminopeptidase [Candidatus Pacearchaeota archaeon CG_4_10_14_0_8_um_filter_35_169]PIZ79399.1 MAG: type II methionyl aminopeptidase [Candidatus Pacearchaeota archaeon CG_4_10_14